jgi:hypothetical protein
MGTSRHDVLVRRAQIRLKNRPEDLDKPRTIGADNRARCRTCLIHTAADATPAHFDGADHRVRCRICRGTDQGNADSEPDTEGPATFVWNASQAADAAGVHRRTIERKLAAGTLDPAKNPTSGEWEITPTAMIATGFRLVTTPDTAADTVTSHATSRRTDSASASASASITALQAEVDALGSTKQTCRIACRQPKRPSRNAVTRSARCEKR